MYYIYIIFIASTGSLTSGEKCNTFPISYCTFNIALYELPKIVKAKEV